MIPRRKATMTNTEIISLLRPYFRKREDVAFSLLFGSGARSRLREQSDIDIAIYFFPECPRDIEWEETRKSYPQETRIALDLEGILGKDVDLIVLNKARVTLADEIVRKGTKIHVRDKGLLLDFLCTISDEAEWTRNFVIDYYAESQGNDQR